MRILFDVGHPADYYLFSGVIRKLRERGDNVLITVRNREGIVSEILRHEGEEYVLLGENARGMARKAIYMVRNDLKLLRIAKRFKADLFVSLGSPYSGHVSFLMRKPHIAYADTEISWLINLMLAPPFATTVMTPTSVNWRVSFSNRKYINGTKEMAYLSPKYFTPNLSVLREVGVGENDRIIVLRFSAHDSHHDIGVENLSDESKKRLVMSLAKLGRVLIFTEVDLPPELRPFVLRIGRIHDLLASASLYVGEGVTMASEAAVLGVPTVFIHPRDFGSIADYRKYGLVTQFKDPENELDQIIAHCQGLLTDSKSRDEYAKRRDAMLSSKGDVVSIIMSEINGHR
jgi:predicted glycosyltransferase